MNSTLLTILLVVLTVPVIGQRKFSVGLEYAMGISETTNPGFGFHETEGVQQGRNAFLKGGYRLNKNMEATLGIGYLVTKELERLFFSIFEDVDFTEAVRSHHYITIPVGIKYNIGSFFVNPEFGIGISNGHNSLQYNYSLENNSTSVTTTSFETSSTLYHRISLPLFLTFGNEIDLKPVKLLIGVKGYYSLNNLSDIFFPSGHMYGVGIMTGIKF